MITEQYVTYETAKMLKEAGFDIACRNWYADDNLDSINAPTQQLAARWLREYYSIHVSIEPYANMWHWILWKTNGTFVSNSSKAVKKEFESYEKGMEAGLQEALRIIIKDKKR